MMTVENEPLLVDLNLPSRSLPCILRLLIVNLYVQTNSVLAVIGVHDGEAHVNLSFRTEPAMFGIKFSF